MASERKNIQKPTVVVVIAYYNGSQWIDRAARSVAEQTIKADEFIIVNDGSKPEERDYLHAIRDIYNFTIVDKSNGGQGSARNAGVYASKSAFISFLDQDDYYLPQHIEDLTGALPENDARLGFVYADLCAGNEAGMIDHSNMLREQPGRHPLEGSISALLQRDLFVLPSASLIKRQAFEAVGGFDEQFMGYEDDDLFLRMFRSGFTNHFLDKPVTVWCMRTESTSYTTRMSRSRFRYFKKLAHLYPDEPKKNRFFLRDCLLPRFADTFFKEALEAKWSANPDYGEIKTIVLDFASVVGRNKSVNPLYSKWIAYAVNILDAGILNERSLDPFSADALPIYVGNDRVRQLSCKIYFMIMGTHAEEKSIVPFFQHRLDRNWRLDEIAVEIEKNGPHIPFAASGADDELLNTFVEYLYDIFLLRRSDFEGFKHHVFELKKGVKVSDILRGFASSGEFKARYRIPFGFYIDRGLLANPELR